MHFLSHQIEQEQAIKKQDVYIWAIEQKQKKNGATDCPSPLSASFPTITHKQRDMLLPAY